MNEQPLDREVTMNSTIARDSSPRWADRTAASPAQFQLISDMAKERGINVADIFKRPETVQEAKTVINWLKAQTKASNANQAGSNLPSPAAPAQYDGLAPAPKDGKKARAWHYALKTEDGVKFYRVKRGYKPGYYFVDVQASDSYYPIRNRASRTAILDAIANNPKAALALYGQELGRCGRCGITLTSDYRELGIGPVCINK